jgi:hypothetical protein
MLGVAPENIRGLIYGIDPGSHRHLWPSFLGADPWSCGDPVGCGTWDQSIYQLNHEGGLIPGPLRYIAMCLVN